ncbi:hypothetical protein RSK20926_11779 [Roseobacter sp. SK209-2-6]|uniref:DUF3168 domain-containing protein n=1 Tax=Roseobacter sp. SK209-2-6 TaxID=388739 RepID=UPI0000F3C5A2|nr:DUF3168 domain-containing protein [Roseobacter sp. SK209-2-6]EBA18397.1 hypothetical protein RSK20926_11779 [Roseobacter sp. SK209-2-6]
MSLSIEIQKAILQALQESVELSNFTDGEIAENAPSAFSRPYVTLGPSSFVEANSDGIKSRSETLQIDCWPTNGSSSAEAKRMVDLAYDVLNNPNLVLPSPYAFCFCQVELSRTVELPAGQGVKGVLQITVTAEDHR